MSVGDIIALLVVVAGAGLAIGYYFANRSIIASATNDASKTAAAEVKDDAAIDAQTTKTKASIATMTEDEKAALLWNGGAPPK